MGYFDRIEEARREARRAAPTSAGVTPIRPDLATELHPYAARVIDLELGRLDALARPWHQGAAWDTTTFEVACNLIELANSPWSGYPMRRAEEDLRTHAPRDHAWGEREHAAKWESARQRVGDQGRPEPALGSPEVIEDPSLAAELVAREIEASTAGELEGSDAELVAEHVERVMPVIDWPALFATDDEEEDWILEPVLPARRLVALFSAPKVGKSLLMLELAVAIARGTEALGVTPDRPRVVLYVDFENDPRGDVRTRLEAMRLGPGDLENLRYASFPTLAKLDTAAGGADLMRAVAHYAAEVVVIDTVSRAVQGEENDNDTWLAFYRHTGLALKQAGVACIRLDHTGKDKERGMRGGSAKYGDVDAVWRLQSLGEDLLALECTDHRMPVPEKLLTLKRESSPLRHTVNGDRLGALLDAQDRRVIRLLEELGLPFSIGQNAAYQAIRGAGHEVTRNEVRRAIKARAQVLEIDQLGLADELEEQRP